MRYGENGCATYGKWVVWVRIRIRKRDLLLQALLQRERLRRVDDEGLETIERAATANL